MLKIFIMVQKFFGEEFLKQNEEFLLVTSFSKMLIFVREKQFRDKFASLVKASTDNWRYQVASIGSF